MKADKVGAGLQAGPHCLLGSCGHLLSRELDVSSGPSEVEDKLLKILVLLLRETSPRTRFQS